MLNQIITAPCIIPGPVVADPRCLSSEFSLANPTLCPGGTLILKPSVAMLCQLEAVEFRVFEYVQGVETELTSGVRFASSDNSVLAIGVNSGNGTAIGTGLEAGIVTVTATHTDGRMAVAEATVLPGARCCDEIRVLTAIVVDNSLSMSLVFNSPGFITPYPKRLTFAKAMAASYGGVLYEVDGVPKDADRVWAVNETVTASFAGFSDDVNAITDAIAAITQTQYKTDLLPVFTTITNDLLAETADRRVLLLISDGEHTSNTNRQAVITAAATFKSLGGIIAVVGIRASGDGYDLLERLATPGFFLNSTAANADEVIGQFNYLKSLLCAGFCEPMGDVWVNQPALDYFALNNWTVFSGQVNLIGKDLLNLLGIEGLYLETNGGAPATIETIDTYALVLGNDYRISFEAAGNQRQDITGQGLKVYLREVGANDSDPNIFETVVYPAWDSALESYSFAFNSTVNANVKFYVEQLFTGTAPTIGNLLDNIKFEEVTTGATLLNDTFDTENLVYIPPRCGPSAEREAIPDPGIPTVEWVGDYGNDLNIQGQFNYGVSHVTNEGDTAVATVEYVRTETDAHSQTVRRLSFSQGGDRVVSIRIWRSLGEEAADPTATSLFLLAEISAGTTFYLDQEDAEAFTARHEPSVEAPTVNTTAVAAGGLGYGYYAPCCYYEPGEATEPLVPLMTSNTAPSGIVDSGTSVTEAANWWWAFKDAEALSIEKWIGECDFVTGDVQDTEWVQYNFLPAAQTVAAYSFRTHFSEAEQEPPYGWFLEGSNNELDWTLLDTRNDVTDWVYAIPKTFAISAPASFSFYRITFTQARAGIDTEFTISALQFYGGSPATEFTDNCPPCTAGTPGAQASDPTPLADIESGNPPPQPPVSSVEVCVQCPTGYTNTEAVVLAQTGAESIVSGDPGIAGYYHYFALASALRIASFSLRASNNFMSFDFYGSADAVTWTNLGHYLYSTASVVQSYVVASPASYLHYRLIERSWSGENHAGMVLTGLNIVTATAPVTVCATAATVSLATAAATALLHCIRLYRVTASYTARCVTGLGSDVPRSATRTSLNSEDEARQLAEAAAQAEAEAALVCTGSNNTQAITINDRTGLEPARATPYPSVKFVSGMVGTITKVVVTLNRMNHGNYADAAVLLVSPEGTGVYLMANCMNAAHDTVDRIFHIDDDAATSFPQNSRPGGPGDYEFTYKPTVYVGQISPFPSPAPPPTEAFYETLLSALDGENPNGAWSLYILDDSATNTGYVQFGWDLMAFITS